MEEGRLVGAGESETGKSAGTGRTSDERSLLLIRINRKARYYKLTAAGKKQLTAETNRWRQVVAAIGRVLGETAE